MTATPSHAGGDWQLETYETLPSTADLLAQRAAAGAPDRLAILALHQSAGRGTRGRAWISLRGNLLLSVLLRPAAPLREAPRWALLAAVALAETVAPLLPHGAPLALKWPNDLLLGGAKLAGILTETVASPAGALEAVCLGFGVNLAAAPELTDRPTTCLTTAGIVPPEPEPFAHALLGQLGHWCHRLQRDGFEPVREAWLRYGPAEGAPLLIHQAGRMLSGQFAGLAPDGALLLRDAAGLHAVLSGELGFPGRVAAQERA